MNLVIVESPAKAKTINKYLGSGYQVLASYGHVRDLPSKDGSVRPDDDFAMDWEVDAKAQKRMSDIVKAVKDADRVILATDPDREGEAISWHVHEILKQKRVLKDKPVERVVFNAVTREAVLEAMRHPRPVDASLVDAYLARRALDYLVGFTLSPVLWRKLPGARSAGRVQSVALRLVCDRETEIELFKPREYWQIEATLETGRRDTFVARLVGFAGQKLGRLDVGNETEARRIERALTGANFTVDGVDTKPTKRNPYPPFTTSTLQQEASRKLGFAATRTMQIAQRLYEGIDIGGETVGLITYMRTDGVQIVPEAIGPIRSAIGQRFGAAYLPDRPRAYTSKAKNAQEAHEAIRPTDPMRHPDAMSAYLDAEQAKLYELIWKRTLASQMTSADLERTSIEITASGKGETANLRATGTVIVFPGFLTLYQETLDDEQDEDSARLPQVTAGEKLTERGISTTQHFTEPPPRYTEATLIKKMEELGIGRPSTYTATLATLRDRGYVRIDKKRLHPEDKGRLVTAFLESFFDRYVEYDFTADLEAKLDLISNGEIAWKDVLREFWTQFSSHVEKTKELRVSAVLDALNDLLAPHIFPPRADGSDPRTCPVCGTGKLSLKLSRFGAFIGCSNYPECKYTRQLAVPTGEDGEAAPDAGTRTLGVDPETGMEVTVRNGRFGYYLQLGEAPEGKGKEKEKPKRASIPKGWDPQTIDLEAALSLLALPRPIGLHPETGKEITAGIGRYGPFVLHDGKFANLDSVEEVFSVGINRAVSLLAEKAASGGGRRFGASTPGRSLGDHPSLGGSITVRSGRFGPYVNHGKINATLPRAISMDTITLDQAVDLIAKKADQPSTGAKPKRSAKPKATAKPKSAPHSAKKKAS